MNLQSKGGGIFSTLGVVVGIAGSWAWLSFAMGGLIALASGYSYVKLASHYGEGGGAFTFLREINADGFAGGLSWVLIVGYVLTNAVYAFTFEQYLGHVIDADPWFPRFAAVAIMVIFIGLNLRRVGEAGGVEVFLVQRVGFRMITGFGALTAGAACVTLIIRLIKTEPMALIFLGIIVLIVIFGRPILLRHVKVESHN